MSELSTLGPVIKIAYEAQANTNAFTDEARDNIIYLMGKTGFSGAFSDLTGVPDFMLANQRGVANGVASLDAAGLVPLNQLNVSGLAFKGAWNPNTNDQGLVDGTGNTGDFYKASHAGSFNAGNGSYTYAAGDWIIFAGGTWNRLGSADTVSMVNGKLGAVVLNAADVGALPATYVAPVTKVNGKVGDITLTAGDVGAKPSNYVPSWNDLLDRPAPTPIPKLEYVDRKAARTASTWVENTSAYDRIVNISTNYVASAASSSIEMRKMGTTTPIFSAKSQATGTGDTNQIMQAIVPAGWQYRFVPGASRTISTWFEGDYA